MDMLWIKKSRNSVCVAGGGEQGGIQRWICKLCMGTSPALENVRDSCRGRGVLRAPWHHVSSLAQHLWAPTQTEGPRGGVDAARGDVRKQRQALFVAQHFSTLPRLPQLSVASVPGSVQTCAPQRSRSTLKQHLRSWAGLKAWGMIPA